MTKTDVIHSPGGVQTRIYWQGDNFTVETYQDVELILEQNKAEITHNDGYTTSGAMKRAGRIPMVIIAKWLTEEGLDVYNPDHWFGVKRKLNSNEYRYLRTAEGVL